MKKNNTEYEIAKGELAEYIAEMESNYIAYKECLEHRESGYDYTFEENFCKMWEKIQELSVADRNLLLIHNLYGRKCDKTLAVFNGVYGGLKQKNASTLSKKLYKIKKKIYDTI